MRFLRLALLAVASSALLGVDAAAQQYPNCPLTTGRDIITGEVGASSSAVSNHSQQGGVLDAASLATTSCNIGSVTANWISGTVNHPLIGQGIFKYKVVNGAGRYEQLGQSWVKHAFAAFQQNLCCTTCPGGAGTFSFLAPGCSDPYTAARNGSQSLLGPKYQVNANTGQYNASPPHPSGGNAGRDEMLMSDLEPSSGSVRYFGECMYVALDDAQDNNNDNNCSFRELTCSVGTSTQGYNFAVTGATQRMLPGIQGWQTAEPGVVLTDVIVPEDSVAPYDGNARLVLGSSVTDLGGGQWHYEYALYNMNSHRSIGSFSVPIPPGVNVSNIGFHDVAYRAGDGEGGVNYDGTDWTGTLAGGALTWATTPMANNNNANALRWGTTYNFRFDADFGPSTGTITLGQWRVVNNVPVTNVEVPGAPVFEAFCSNGSLGTDHTTACPCGNVGAASNGCAHSFSASGSNLTATGTAAADDVILDATNLPSTSFTLFMQHDAAADGIFHDGVLCAGGSLIRLRGRGAVGGQAIFPNSAFPNDATLTLSQRGSVTVGSGALRFYAAWYRNASTTFCPPATANVSNGFKIVW